MLEPGWLTDPLIARRGVAHTKLRPSLVVILRLFILRDISLAGYFLFYYNANVRFSMYASVLLTSSGSLLK